jgi:hypothetical protein
MDQQQKIVVWVGLIVIVAMGIYPPWIESLDTTFLSDGLKVGPRSGGYHWIFRPPEVPQWAWSRKSEQLKTEVLWNHSLDVPRLLVQWAMVCFVVGGLVWTLKADKT